MNSLDGLKSLRIHNHSNIILSYLNINSIRNKFDDLELMVNENLDILCIAETKIEINPFQLHNFFYQDIISLTV